jgi:leader peptidase (prepilin peptidase) / N-methyltransferase
VLTVGVTLIAALAGGASGFPAARAAAARAVGEGTGPDRDRDADGLAVILPDWVWALIGATAAGVVGLRFAHRATLAAYLILAIGSVVISAVDLAANRIQDSTLAVVAAAAASCLAAQVLFGAGVASIERAALAAVVVGLFFLGVALLAGGKFGLGDVKLLMLLAFMLGYQSWIAVERGVMLGLLLNIAGGLALRATRRIRLVPLAPWLLAGALIALVL